MRLIVDAGPIVALSEPRHPDAPAIRAVLLNEPLPPLLSPAVAAEADYLLQRLRIPRGNHALLKDLAAGRMDVPSLEPADLRLISDLNRQYVFLDVGLADLSIVALASRFRTTRVLTLDQRHFRVLQPVQGGHFTLLPYDEDIG